MASRREFAEALDDLRRATGSDGLRDAVMGWTVWPAACPVCGYGALIGAEDLLPTCTSGAGCRPDAIAYRLRAHADELAQLHCRFTPEAVLEAARELHEAAEQHRSPDGARTPWEALTPADRWRAFLAARGAINQLAMRRAEPVPR
jgi:hypothetical protein